MRLCQSSEHCERAAKNKMIGNQKSLDRLITFDPELTAKIVAGLADNPADISDALVAVMIEDILWAIGSEVSFGQAVADGYAALCAVSDEKCLERFHLDVGRAGQQGPTLGRIIAHNLPEVLKTGDMGLADRFSNTINGMLEKGTYTLKGPLSELVILLKGEDVKSAAEYLKLLKQVFIADIAYNQSLHFTYVLPRAIHDLPRRKRSWQIADLCRVAEKDIRLVDPFLDGLARGLQTLNEQGLKQFADEGLKIGEQKLSKARAFFALESEQGRNLFEALQVAVSFTQVAAQLNRYLRARIGHPVSLRPISDLSETRRRELTANTLVATDGKTIYLVDEIDSFQSRSENQRLYKCLVRFESGLLEFNSFDFDLDIWGERYQTRVPVGYQLQNTRAGISDLQQFFEFFSRPQLISDLFTIFEHGRIRVLLAHYYPGLVRQYLPYLQEPYVEARQLSGLLERLYAAIGLDLPDQDRDAGSEFFRTPVKLFQKTIGPETSVEDSAWMSLQAYLLLEDNISQLKAEDLFLSPPFGRRISPVLYDAANRIDVKKIDGIRQRLNKAGYKVYRSVIRKHLQKNRHGLSEDDLRSMIRESMKEAAVIGDRENDLPSGDLLNMDGLSDLITVSAETEDISAENAAWYREWDFRLADYLYDHTRVIDRSLGGLEDGFYDRTLEKYWGLVKRIRHSFELLKPEGLKIFRQWIEGDEFDYRALVDFAVDRKTGRSPSDR